MTPELHDEIENLGPWHFNYEIEGEMTARIGGRTIGTHRPEKNLEGWREYFTEGMSVLDLACNSGGYLFWIEKLFNVKELIGIEIRDHWRNQFLFLKEKLFSDTNIAYYQDDVMNLSEIIVESVDLVICKGIFYHVPRPLEFINYVADVTNKICIFNTITTNEKQNDGVLYYNRENEELISGVNGYGYVPDGPEICEAMLKDVGFKRTQVTSWGEPGKSPPRLEIIASKE